MEKTILFERDVYTDTGWDHDKIREYLQKISSDKEKDILISCDISCWFGKKKEYRELHNLSEVTEMMKGSHSVVFLENGDLIVKDCGNDGSSYYRIRYRKPSTDKVKWSVLMEKLHENKADDMDMNEATESFASLFSESI